MPSSMPMPARRIGTMSGTGRDSRTPGERATGVDTLTSSTRMPRVASYASSVTNSSASRRNVAESVFSSRSAVSLCATSG